MKHIWTDTHRPSARTPNTRGTERRAVALPARLTWKDQRGTTRLPASSTRNVSEFGVYVECQSPVSIPLFRLVQFQLERDVRESDALPGVAAAGPRARRRLPRVAADRARQPQGLALRLMVDPKRRGRRGRADARDRVIGIGSEFEFVTRSDQSANSDFSTASSSSTSPARASSDRTARPPRTRARRPRSAAGATRGAAPRRTTLRDPRRCPPRQRRLGEARRQLQVRRGARSGARRPARAGRSASGTACRAASRPMRRRLSRQASRSMSGGGVGGRTKPPGLKPDAGRVADERDAGVGAEVADVVRGVPGRVGDLEVAAAAADPLAALQDDQRVRGTGGTRPTADPSRRRTAASRSPAASPDRPCAARPSRARRRAAPGFSRTQRAGGARVIEMNVREQDRAHDRAIAMPAPLERGAQRRQRARRPGIDERHAARTVEDDGRDDARHAEEVEVEIRQAGRECDHGVSMLSAEHRYEPEPR